MKKTMADIKKYWDERAEVYIADPRATTGEYWLREIEIREIIRRLQKIKKKKNILDVGCGDGYSTIKILQAFPGSYILGLDYSESMIRNAELFLKKEKISSKNIEFLVWDALKLRLLNKKFDVIISDRCLINLPTCTLQKKAIQEIQRSLIKGGYYIMLENFLEGHRNMNNLRRRLGLNDIPIRWHNLFFNEKFLQGVILRYFNLIERTNIASLFYLITKVVYSKLCYLENKEPDYNHILYKVAVDLDEISGNYGPLNLLLLKKKQ
jgi:ubiquinone/menaquinone biosynthesis C-methylase UbiE